MNDRLPEQLSRSDLIEVVEQLRESQRLLAVELHDTKARLNRMSNLLDLAADTILVGDTRGYFTEVNQNASLLSGYSREELLTMHMGQLFSPEQLKEKPLRYDLLKMGQVIKNRRLLLRRDGSTVPIEMHSRMLPDGSSHAIIRDISEQQAHEEVLQESEAKFRQIFGSSPDAICINTLDKGIFVEVNRGFTRTTGYRPEEVIGRGIEDLQLFQHRTDCQALRRRLRNGGACTNRETWIRTEAGHLLPCLISARRIRLSGSEHVISVTRNIQDLRQAENERQALAEQLQQAHKLESIGRLAGGIAHDFNNMLAVIIGQIDLALKEAGSNGSLRRNLQEIDRAAKHSAELTRQLLGFARKQPIAPQVLAINDTLVRSLEMLERLLGEGIQLKWLPGTDCWPVRIDPYQIDQIVTNLCLNARDAIGGTGTITIGTGNQTLSDEECADNLELLPGEYVCLRVTDHGCGMNQHVLRHIFEPFFTTRAPGKGAGLGLANVYGIVKQNHGCVVAESTPGLGTTMMVYLPRFNAAPGELPHTGTTPPKAILFVESNPSIREVGTMMLTELGYRVWAFASPSQALNQVDEVDEPPDLLLTDLFTAEMDGPTLAEQLQPRFPGIQRLYMSGYAPQTPRQPDLTNQGLLLLHKPFTLESLVSALNQALDDD